MFSHFVFMHDSGNYGFDFDEGSDSTHFVVTTILVEANKHSEVEQKLDELGLEKLISKQCLEQLSLNLINIDFGIHVIVINKKQLRQDGGFGNKDSISKYSSELIYQDLFKQHMDIQIQAQYTQTPFMNSFETYIVDRLEPTLFDSSAITFLDKSDCALMTLARLISEFILSKYEQNAVEQDDVLRQLSQHILRIKTFPNIKLNVDINTEFDEIIAKHAIHEAQYFIQKYKNSKIQVRQDRVNFLKFLLTQLSYRPSEYIYSQEIIQNMITFSPDSISKEYLMRDIIGPLRDTGVLIASTSKGYKIPISSDELIEYVDFSSSMALPILWRIYIRIEKVLDTKEK